MVRAHSGILSYDSQRLSPRFVMKYTLQSAQLNHFAILLKLLITQYCKPQPTHTLAWKIPWMEEPGRLQSMES